MYTHFINWKQNDDKILKQIMFQLTEGFIIFGKWVPTKHYPLMIPGLMLPSSF